MMKLAVSGKGGAGKTTLAALAAAELLRRGIRVTAIDADPNPTLAPCLGITAKPTPLLEMSDEIEARVGSGVIRLNPRVDDLVDKIAVSQDGLQLIVAGGPIRGGAGCACPQSTLLRQLLEHVVTGLEAADALLVVVEPTNASVETAARIARLAADIDLRRVALVANRIVDPTDMDFIKERLPELELVGEIPFSHEVLAAERDRRPLIDLGGPAVVAVAGMLDALAAGQSVAATAEEPVPVAAEPPEEVPS
jgi:CO dehydrogenase maturation factor